MRHAEALAAITNPTVNSYKRLVPGFEAPVHISWARNNRSGLIRVPIPKRDNPMATRIEYRSADPACNDRCQRAAGGRYMAGGRPPGPIGGAIRRICSMRCDTTSCLALPSCAAAINSPGLRRGMDSSIAPTKLDVYKLAFTNLNSLPSIPNGGKDTQHGRRKWQRSQ